MEQELRTFVNMSHGSDGLESSIKNTRSEIRKKRKQRIILDG